jgi:acyl-CoA thioesterase-1
LNIELPNKPAHTDMTQSHCVQEQIKPVRILVVGDSLSTEYGLAPRTGWVEQLKLALDRELPTAVVKNASNAGNTTSHGVSRLNSLLLQQTPTHVIIALGAVDALRGLPLDLTKKILPR